MLYVNPEAGFRSTDLAPGAKGRETEALKQYEQLFLFEMLKEMRKTVPDYGFFDSGGQKEYFEEMMDDFLAGEMASSGQLGVAKQMEQQLRAQEVAASLKDASKVANTPYPTGIPTRLGTLGIEIPKNAAKAFEINRNAAGFELNPVRRAGIAVSRAHESYQINE